MCGRYASSRTRAVLMREFGVNEEPKEELPPRFNIAPTTGVYVVRDLKDRMVDDRQARVLDVAHWGLIPGWAKDPSIGNRMINARAETVAEKPAYRRAFTSRRCILPGDGFYEWQKIDVPEGTKPRKQPYFLHPADGSSLAMAGLYEWWRNPQVADDDAAGAWVLSATILTTSAIDDIGRIHDRMPVVVPPSLRDSWLDPDTQGSEVLPLLLHPPEKGYWDIYPVSTAVNSVRNQGPQLMDRIETGEIPGAGMWTAPEAFTVCADQSGVVDPGP
ncbi:MAG: SOS response-associated peptidase [Actinobacteria bacterium]|nr:SOS response-associated peptidase [Actinomycetota bacterium]